MASKMAIVSLLRTWTGLLHICHSKDMISSFVDALSMPNEAVRVSFNVFAILGLIVEILINFFFFFHLISCSVCSWSSLIARGLRNVENSFLFTLLLITRTHIFRFFTIP